MSTVMLDRVVTRAIYEALARAHAPSGLVASPCSGDTSYAPTHNPTNTSVNTKPPTPPLTRVGGATKWELSCPSPHYPDLTR